MHQHAAVFNGRQNLGGGLGHRTLFGDSKREAGRYGMRFHCRRQAHAVPTTTTSASSNSPMRTIPPKHFMKRPLCALPYGRGTLRLFTLASSLVNSVAAF